ncbi:hypothetical protein EMN47_02015 [Prolixibacteraceae bacterium JC049]|nr:hypothetical protein [Prolixibacteraceae bacterium JC049]
MKLNCDILRKTISIIASDYINAISIYKSLNEVSYQGEIIFLNTTGQNLAGHVLKNKVRVIDFFEKEPSELLTLLKSFKSDKIKYLFLTNEIFHQVIWNNKQLLRDLNVTYFIGNTNPHKIINKDIFLKEIEFNTNVPVPYSVDATGNDFVDDQFPILVKFASSFSNGRKTPKSKRVDSKEELIDYLKQIESNCFNRNDVILQELLSEESKHNVSVCGWYDKETTLFFQTRKILQHPPKVGNGDVIVWEPLNSDLESYTKEICAHFDYEGPFEMEFIKSNNNDDYKIIEMNPRFWMQHGLIEQISNHYLIKKYLGISVNNEVNEKYRYWVYPLYAIYKVCRLNLKYMPYLLTNKTYWPISFSQSLKYLIIRFFRALYGKK